MRIITVKIETDSEESFDFIKADIEQELSCCWNMFDKVEIFELPSAQIEIVRCKDCAYGEKLPDNIRCELHDYLRFDYEDFCSMGVKRVTGN